MTTEASPNTPEPVGPLPPCPPPDGFKYSAFISYSHTDKKPGLRLHRYLERYRTSRRLVGTPGRDGPVVKTLRPVFLDREELPSEANLSVAVTAALAASRYLVVVCSPRAAASRWVNAEVLTYKRLGRAGQILAFIIDGDPNATDKGHPADECFPPALRYALAPNGELSTTQRVEPVAADSRPVGDGLRRARLKLIAGLLGVGLGEFLRRWFWHQLEKAACIAVLSAVVLFAVGAVVFKWREARDDAHAHEQAEQQARVEERQQRLRLAEETLQQGIELCNQGDVDRGLLRLAAAMAQVPAEADAANVRAVARAAIANWSAQRHRLVGALDLPKDAELIELGPGGKLVVTTHPGGFVRLWDPVTGAEAAPAVRHGASVTAVGFDPPRGRLLTAGEDGTVQFWDVKTGQAKGDPIRHGSKVVAMTVAPKGGRLATAANVPEADGQSSLRLWDLATGKPTGPATFDRAGVSGLALSPDGTRLATRRWNDLHLWDAATGKRIGDAWHDLRALRHGFSPDGRTLVSVAGKWTRDGRLIHSFGERTRPFGGNHLHGSEVEVLDAVTGTQRTSRPLESPYLNLCLATVGEDLFMLGACDPTDASGVFTYYHVLDPNRRFGNAKAASTGTLVPIGEPIRFRTPVSAIGAESASTAAIGTWDGAVAVWNVGRSKRESPPMRHVGRPQAIWCGEFGDRVVVRAMDPWPAGSEARGQPPSGSQEVRVWERKPSYGTAALPLPDPERVLIAAGGSRVIALRSHGDARVSVNTYVAATGAAAASFVAPGQPPAATAAASAPRVAVADGVSVRVYDAATGRQIGPVITLPSPPLSLALSGNGRMLAAGLADRVLQYSVDEPQPARRSRPVRGSIVVLNDGGDRLLVVSGFTTPDKDGKPGDSTIDVALFSSDTDGGASLARRLSGTPVDATLDAGGRRIAVVTTRGNAGAPNALRVWREDGSMLGQAVGRQSFSHVAFALGGAVLVTRNADEYSANRGGLQLWDADHVRPLGGEFLTLRAGVTGLASSGDGQNVIATLAGGGNKPPQMLTIPVAAGEDPDRVRTAVEAAIGLELLPSGEDRILSPEAWRRRASVAPVPR